MNFPSPSTWRIVMEISSLTFCFICRLRPRVQTGRCSCYNDIRFLRIGFINEKQHTAADWTRFLNFHFHSFEDSCSIFKFNKHFLPLLKISSDLVWDLFRLPTDRFRRLNFSRFESRSGTGNKRLAYFASRDGNGG